MDEVPRCLAFPYCTVYILDQAERSCSPDDHHLNLPDDRSSSPDQGASERLKQRLDSTGDSDSGMSSIASRRSTRIRSEDQSSSRTGEKKSECVVKSTDMNEDMQRAAMEVAIDAMNKYRVEKDIATFIKEEFDKRFSPTWHCVVGRNFGSYVTHETNHFIYFYIQHVAVMLFKTGFP